MMQFTALVELMWLLGSAAVPNNTDSSWIDDGWTQRQWQELRMAGPSEGTGTPWGHRGCFSRHWSKGM